MINMIIKQITNFITSFGKPQMRSGDFLPRYMFFFSGHQLDSMANKRDLVFPKSVNNIMP